MRSFSKKLAFVLAAAMVVTAFAPAAKAEAAKEMAINKSSQILYVNEGINHKGGEVAAPGKGNVSVYDFSVKNKPADWKTAYSFAWSSSDEDVVSVAKGGVATAVGVGKATVYCKVTEKATKEVTTLKTKVTVKANAYKVEISNADKWDGATVEVDGVVDLNRTMYDEDGNKTTKRGTLVTDYTKWVAEPAAGVEIDQKTGKFTFTEAAVAGEYKLSCYTYQSSKYTEKTAESDVVVVEFVKADKFEIDQTASNGFNLVFGKEANVAIADVTVNKIIKVGDSTGKLPMVVSGVTMSEDKKTASVSLFSNFENGATYEISVKGYEEIVTLTAFVGKPVSMTISSDSGIQNGMFVTINTETKLTYKLFDEQGNDVTNTLPSNNVFFSTANYNVNDYYVAGSNPAIIYIYKEGVQAAVNAEFHTADGKITASATFVGVAETPVAIKSATLTVKRPWAGYANNIIPLDDCYDRTYGTNNVGVEFMVQTTAWNDYYAKNYSSNITNEITYLGYDHDIEFRSSNPDVADVVWAERYGDEGYGVNNYNQTLDASGNVIKDAKLKMFKTGTTAVLADIVTINQDGSKNVVTVASTYVTVDAPRTFKKMENFNNNGSIVVGNVEDFSEESITFLAKDQYGDCLELENFTYTFANNTPVPTDAISYTYADGWKSVFTVDGSKFNLEGASSKQFYIKVKADVKDENTFAGKYGKSNVEFSFVVTVRSQTSASISLSVQCWSDMPNGTNVGRYYTNDGNNNNTERVKKTTFQVFEMNNGIKVGQLTVYPMVGTDAATVGNYYYTIERNGVDVTACTDMISAVGKDIVLNYSTTTSADMTTYSDNTLIAATGSAVSYSSAVNGKAFGAGTYVFTVYKAEVKSGNTVFTQVGATSASATLDNGNYTYVKRLSESAQFTDSNGVPHLLPAGLWNNDQLKTKENQEILRNCFEIKNRDNQNASAPFYVDAVLSDRYVFVKSITFYEAIGNGEYAPYTVNVNVSLTKPQ